MGFFIATFTAMQPDLKYLIALEMVPMVGSVTAKKLIAFCGSAEAVFSESKKNLRRIPGVGEAIAAAVARQNVLHKAEEELVFTEKNGITIHTYLDGSYPNRLKQCEDSPLILYQKGGANLNAERLLSIVGTRKATPYGVACCEQLVEQLKVSGHNPIIVSGLAYGIDVCAHKAALKYGLTTVGVMATGLNTVYPAQHRSVARQMEEQGGALVSDFPSSAKLDRNSFLKRNRIIAGLADATVIVESGEKGGALVTADIAMSYSRDVLAFPGRVNDSQSKGCNGLIKRNKAALIESIEDLEYALGWDRQVTKPPIQLPLFGNLSNEEQRIVAALSECEVETIDNLYRKTEIPVAKLSSMLLSLEFSGYVRSLPGKSFGLKIK